MQPYELRTEVKLHDALENALAKSLPPNFGARHPYLRLLTQAAIVAACLFVITGFAVGVLQVLVLNPEMETSRAWAKMVVRDCLQCALLISIPWTCGFATYRLLGHPFPHRGVRVLRFVQTICRERRHLIALQVFLVLFALFFYLH